MNLKAVYEEVAQTMKNPGAPFSVYLEIWHYGLANDPTIKVSIWDGSTKERYEGATPGEALEAFHRSHHPLAAVEAVEVPEAGG